MKAFLTMYRNELLIALMLVIALVLSAGCAQLGVTQVKRAPHNVLEALYMANSTGRGMTIAVNQLRVDRLISDGQHANALEELQKARDAVTQGIDAYSLGHFTDAQTGLDKAEVILTLINALVVEAQSKQHAVLFYLTSPPQETPT